jgi:hypothetical protein
MDYLLRNALKESNHSIPTLRNHNWRTSNRHDSSKINRVQVRLSPQQISRLASMQKALPCG